MMQTWPAVKANDIKIIMYALLRVAYSHLVRWIGGRCGPVTER